MSVEHAAPHALSAWRKAGPWLLAGLLLVGLGRLTQASLVDRLEAAGIETKPAGLDTPASYGAPFQDLSIPVAGRAVTARAVLAGAAGAPAVLIFHGNGETIADWSQVQARLYRAGISSMVFDYAGFGLSPGKPGVGAMREDALAAYRQWTRLTPGAGSRVLIGHSLGNAVMLDSSARLQPAVSGIVVHAGFTSARDYAVHAGMVSPWLARLLPDLWDNEAALTRPGPTVLVLHGDRDEVIPLAMGRRLAEASSPRSLLKVLPGVGHDGFYLAPAAQEWDPIIDFVRGLAARPAR
jgi:alpha-beta hydrolase superfamily lysophospholipase